MLVKINGILFNPERALRFAPKRKNGLRFEATDICTPENFEFQKRYITHTGMKYWTVNRMGWRFLFWTDGCGNVFPQAFTPMSGKVEIQP